MTAAAPRVALAVLAVVIVAWLAVLERDTRSDSRARKALRPGASAAQLRGAEQDLRAARRFNPDTQPRIDLALLYRARGETRRAVAAMEAVLRDEPDNVVGWAVLSVLARGTDRAAAARGAAAVRRLDPYRARRARSAAPSP